MNVVTRLSSPKSWHGELIEIVLVLVLVLVLDWFFLSGGGFDFADTRSNRFLSR